MAISEDLEEGYRDRLAIFTTGVGQEVNYQLRTRTRVSAFSVVSILAKDAGYLAKALLEQDEVSIIQRRCLRVAVLAGLISIEGGADEAPRFCSDLFAEVLRAREKFPSPNLNALAMFEEIGELAESVLDGFNKPNVRKEAVQVAAMAARVAIEGDPSTER